MTVTASVLWSPPWRAKERSWRGHSSCERGEREKTEAPRQDKHAREGSRGVGRRDLHTKQSYVPLDIDSCAADTLARSDSLVAHGTHVRNGYGLRAAWFCDCIGGDVDAAVNELLRAGRCVDKQKQGRPQRTPPPTLQKKEGHAHGRKERAPPTTQTKRGVQATASPTRTQINTPPPPRLLDMVNGLPPLPSLPSYEREAGRKERC